MPHLYQLAGEAAARLGLSSSTRWCCVVYCALGRRPRLRRDVLGAVARELAAHDLLDGGRFSARRLLAAAGLAWRPKGGGQ